MVSRICLAHSARVRRKHLGAAVQLAFLGKKSCIAEKCGEFFGNKFLFLQLRLQWFRRSAGVQKNSFISGFLCVAAVWFLFVACAFVSYFLFFRSAKLCTLIFLNTQQICITWIIMPERCNFQLYSCSPKICTAEKCQRFSHKTREKCLLGV